MLDEIVDCLGEGWIGGPWDARDDLWRHTVSVLDAVAVERLGTLTDSLASWRATARASSPAAILLPLCLWWQATQLWDRSLAYRTIWVVTEAVAQSVAGGTAAAAAAASRSRGPWSRTCGPRSARPWR